MVVCEGVEVRVVEGEGVVGWSVSGVFGDGETLLSVQLEYNTASNQIRKQLAREI